MFDLDYDDLWVADFPQTIGGFNVDHISTPKNRACTSDPVVSLQTTHSSLDEFLSNPPDVNALEKKIKSLPGVPSDFRLSFSNASLDKQTIADRNNAWNQERLESGCPEPWAASSASDPARGFATFRNKDAGKYTNDNAQSVLITSPSEIGENQDRWSAILNNTMTDDSFFLQSGMKFEDGGGFIGWTDDSVDLVPKEFKKITFSEGAEYYFTNSYTNSVWWLCAGKVVNQSVTPYECMRSPDATGTHLKSDQNTGVTFENANRNAGWQNGFSSTVTARGARIYRDGIGQDWVSQSRVISHSCVGSEYPIEDAISGTLQGGGTGTWTLSGIPLACVP